MTQAACSTGEGLLALHDQSLADGLTVLRWHLDDLLAGGPTLVVDVSGLSNISSVTLATLLFAQRRCRVRNAQVVLRGPNDRCSELLTRTGLMELFSVS